MGKETQNYSAVRGAALPFGRSEVVSVWWSNVTDAQARVGHHFGPWVGRLAGVVEARTGVKGAIRVTEKASLFCGIVGRLSRCYDDLESQDTNI